MDNDADPTTVTHSAKTETCSTRTTSKASREAGLFEPNARCIFPQQNLLRIFYHIELAAAEDRETIIMEGPRLAKPRYNRMPEAMNGLTNTELFRVEPEMATSLHDMSNEDLCSFAELHEDPINDVQIELYVFTYFLLFTRTLLTEYLKQAIQRTEGWIAVMGLDHPDRARRFQIFDMMSARMYELTYISEELLPILMGEK